MSGRDGRTSWRSLVLGAAVALVLAADLAAAVQTVGRAPDCRKLRNGSFQHGFDGWTVAPLEEATGTASARADVELLDLVAIGGDTSVACLDVASEASVPTGQPASAGRARVALTRGGLVTARYLQLQAFGAFEFLVVGEPRIDYRAAVLVEGESGAVAELSLIDHGFDGRQPCAVALVALGILPIGARRVDLLAHGFSIGERVTLSIVWESSVVAFDGCDAGSFQGFLCVDDLRFCETASSPAHLPWAPVEVRGVGPVAVPALGSPAARRALPAWLGAAGRPWVFRTEVPFQR